MRMLKKLNAALLALVIVLVLSGCNADYKGLNEITIVTGIAIDPSKNDENRYLVSFEVIDLRASISKEQTTSTLLQVEARSISDAMYLINNKSYDQFYFGNTDLLVISHQLLQKDSLYDIMEVFFREAVTRDTMNIIVSKAETAAEIITPDPDMEKVMSYEIIDNLAQNRKTASLIKDTATYQIFNNLACAMGENNILLPAINMETTVADKPEPVLDGLAAFKSQYFMEFIPKDSASLYVLMTQNCLGGVYSFGLEGEDGQDTIVSLVLESSRLKRDFTFENGQFTFFIDMEVDCYVRQMSIPLDSNDLDKIEAIEHRATESLQKDCYAVIERAQRETHLDHFGFASQVYRSDFKLWEEVYEDWETHFSNATIVIRPKFRIKNTGFVKEY